MYHENLKVLSQITFFYKNHVMWYKVYFNILKNVLMNHIKYV